MSGSQNVTPLPLQSPRLLGESAPAQGGVPFGTGLFGNIAIGKDLSGNFAFAPEGVHNIAVRRQAATPENDTFWVAKAREKRLQLVDVTPIVRAGSDSILRVPVRAKKVEIGDVIILSDNPFQVIFVEKGLEAGVIVGLDLNSNIVSHVPSRQLLLQDTQLLVKAVSIFDLFKRHPSRDNQDDNDGIDPMVLALASGWGSAGMSTGMGGGSGQGTIDLNMILLWEALLEDDGDSSFERILPVLAMGNQSGDWIRLIVLLNALRHRHGRHPNSEGLKDA